MIILCLKILCNFFPGSSVIVHLADNVKLAEKKHTFTKLVLLDGKLIGDDWVVTSVVPADFDGDAQMDVMVILAARNDTDGPVKVKLFWGRQTAIDPSEFSIIILF